MKFSRIFILSFICSLSVVGRSTSSPNVRTAYLQESGGPGDLNSDGQVDDSDFSIFVVGYDMLDCADPNMTPGCPADLNNDGLVDDADFSIFVVAYNELLCP